MKITKGQTAPDFAITDIYGKEIKLSSYKGKKIMLGFFRNVNCPFCNLRVHELKKLREKFEEAGLQMIFVFESKPELLKMSIFHTEVSLIPLIGDPSKVLYKQFGVEQSVVKLLSTFFTKGMMDDMKAGKALNLPEDKEATTTLIPADFLIDENFKIATAHYGGHLNDHISIQDIKNFAGI